MKLHVANCTRQNKIIFYRLDIDAEGAIHPLARHQPAKQMSVAPGQQVVLGGRDLTERQVDFLVAQIERFGGAAVSELPRLKVPAPYLWNVDQPVTGDEIREAMALNNGILEQAGAARRKKAAIGVNSLVEKRVAHELALGGIPAPEHVIDVEYEQLDTTEASQKRLGEGFLIRDAVTAARGTGGRFKSRARKDATA